MRKTDVVLERRLYEYTLRAACSPLRVYENGPTSSESSEHVRKLFNVSVTEHRNTCAKETAIKPANIILIVNVKRAKNLLGEDANGLSDPYCRLSVVDHDPSQPPVSPLIQSGLFSCASTKHQKRSASFSRPKNISRISLKKSTSSNLISYKTGVCQQTIEPEWNEQFEFEIEDVMSQFLVISVFDSDSKATGVRNVMAEKRGATQRFRGLRDFFKTGVITDDFLGEVILDIKSIASFDCEKWFQLTAPTGRRSNNRGEILLSLKIHFKLEDTIGGQKRYDGFQFRRRHSVLSSAANSSLVTRSSIFRNSFRQPKQNTPFTERSLINSSFESKHSTISLTDSGLTMHGEFELPLLIEEYHELCRIVFFHELEDCNENQTQWNGELNPTSYSVLAQFRVLYNIPSLSESLIKLLVVMELRSNRDVNSTLISQNVILTYAKIFADLIHQRSDIREINTSKTIDLDFTDYEKTIFDEIFQGFIRHYEKRVVIDAPWFLPSHEHINNVKILVEIIFIIFDLKICSTELNMKRCLSETMKKRLQSDIAESFESNLTHNDNIQSFALQTTLEEFVGYVQKVAESMTLLKDYEQIFDKINVRYINICFFEEKGAADLLAEKTKCVLQYMPQYVAECSKPLLIDTSSLYDPNLIQSSKALITFYLKLQTIVNGLRSLMEERAWGKHAMRLTLIQYQEWFKPIMPFILEGFVAQTRQAIERAVEDDNNPLSDDIDGNLHSDSSIDAAHFCIQLCKDWEKIAYPDPDIQYNALIKLTNTMCEQCQQYARRISRKLSENDYYPDLNQTRSFNVSRKLCILVNDIEYVKQKVLSSLPKLLQFRSIIEKMNDHYSSGDFSKTENTLNRLIQMASDEMTNVINQIFDQVAELVYSALQAKIRAYYKDEKLAREDRMRPLTLYIDTILKNLWDGLEEVQYTGIAGAVRSKTLQCLIQTLPQKEPPEFYQRVLSSLDELTRYFDDICLPIEAQLEEVKTFRTWLESYSLTTEQLQLNYFKEMTSDSSPLNLSLVYGEMLFKVAYEDDGGLITLHIIILSCRNLPMMDYAVFGSCDPYVIVELLPSSFYKKPPIKHQTDPQYNTLDPVFNKTFSIHRLSLNILEEKGAVLRLSVWDKDIASRDDFCGECFVPLFKVRSLTGLASMRDVPVMREKLYRPQFTKQSKSFKLLRSRAEIDKEAAKFVKQRLDVMEHSQDVNNQNTNQGTGRNSSISSSSLQDSDSPVRKLQEMTSTSRHKTSTVWRTVSQSLTTVTDSDIG